jgi:hypothetical protein
MMFDQSTSLDQAIAGVVPATTWWTAAVAGVKSFLVDPSAQSLGLGIQYFGLNGISPGSCDVAQYATPEVEIGALSVNSTAISSSLSNHAPVSFTPTEPALQGALDHMAVWAAAHSGRAPAVILVTDGFPSECDIPSNLGTAPAITDLSTRASAAYGGTYKIRTFVIGLLNGPGVNNLDQVATAGGTKAFHVDPALGDIGAQIKGALLSISKSTLACDFPIPLSPGDAQVIDPFALRLYSTPNTTGTQVEIPWLVGAASCSSHGDNGWYFDSPDPSSATRILVCPGTCTTFATSTVRVSASCVPNTPLQ